MRIARRKVVVSALAALAAPAIARSARADAPIVLKLHHFMSSVSSGHDKFLSPWARKVEAESGGRLRIDIFPSMELGGAPAQLFDQARDGDVDIAWTVPALTPGRFPKIEMFELPFLPSRRALVSSKALEDFAAVHLRDEFAEVHALSFSCTDRGVIHADQPVRSIEDVKGLKLHVQTRFAGEAMRLIGAEPVPMPPGELPMALTDHVVDGCVDPWHLVPPLHLDDLVKAHTEFSDWSVSSATFVLVMNKDAYDKLPRDLKTVLDVNAGQLAAGMAGAMWDLQAAAVADNVAQKGDTIVTLLPEAVAHWRKATEPAVAIWLKEMKERKVEGGKLLASAHALLTKYASLPEPQPPQPAPEAVSQSAPPATDAPPQQKPTTASPPSATAAKPQPAPPAAPPAQPPHGAAQPQPAAQSAPPPPKPAVKPPPPAAKPPVAPTPAPPRAAAASPPPPSPPPVLSVPPTPPAPAPPVPTPPAPKPILKPAGKTIDFPL